MENIKIPLGYEIDTEIEESTDIDSINVPSIFYLEEATRNNNIIILEMEKQIFKVGDKVYDFEFGRGVVVEIAICGFYPVKVKFESNANALYFTRDGKYEYFYEAPRLSFTQYNLIDGGFSQERPIDYEEYIGKWGRFFDKNEVHIAIDKLVDYHGSSADAPFESRFAHYSNFEPLTEEQLKVLNLE